MTAFPTRHDWLRAGIIVGAAQLSLFAAYWLTGNMEFIMPAVYPGAFWGAVFLPKNAPDLAFLAAGVAANWLLLTVIIAGVLVDRRGPGKARPSEAEAG